jgi:hypothetical protein
MPTSELGEHTLELRAEARIAPIFNEVAFVDDDEPDFDFSVDKRCIQGMHGFRRHGQKLVIPVEYVLDLIVGSQASSKIGCRIRPQFCVDSPPVLLAKGHCGAQYQIGTWPVQVFQDQTGVTFGLASGSLYFSPQSDPRDDQNKTQDCEKWRLDKHDMMVFIQVGMKQTTWHINLPPKG